MKSTDPTPKEATFSYDVTFLSKGKHSAFLYLPESYHSHIGLVVAHWGNFEVLVDKCLEALVEAEARAGHVRDTNNWRFSNFKKRRKLLKDICREWLATKQSEAAAKLIGVMDSTGDLHWKRNMIAHGNYSYVILPHSSSVKDCYAFNREKGDRFDFDESVLKKLHHDISHLTADLVVTFKLIGEISGLPFAVISDDEVICTYHDTIHPWNPNPEKRPKPNEDGA